VTLLVRSINRPEQVTEMSRFFKAVAVAALVFTAAPVQAAEFSDTQRSEIGDVVKSYLMQNPEVIRDAMQELQRRQEAAEISARREGVAKYADQLFNSKRHVVLGNPDGDVTLVEFFDYNCGYCKRAHADMERLLEEDKGLRVILKEFPVLGQGSEEAAQVAIAVHQIAPDKFRSFYDELLMSRGAVDMARALAIAVDLGLDKAAIQAQVKDPEVGATINESYGLAQALGINGTPSYVLKDDVLVGAVGYEALKEKIKSVRACGSVEC
jgi:protein-disulfide isomerase